jgi:adhesin transport system membrane fusion protein
MHLEDMVVDRIKPRKVANLLLWIIAGFFVLFFAWAALAQVDRSVHASGRIIPDSRLQVISNLEGGIVREIMVETGDSVTRGQPLIRLDPIQREADFGANSATAVALQAKIARLQGQLTGRAPRYPGDGSADSNQAIAIERALYAAEMAELSSLVQTAEARILQATRAVAEAEANLQSALSQSRSYEQQIGLIRPLVERGIEPRMTLVQLENNVAMARAQADAQRASISRAQANVAEARSALSQSRQDWRSRVATELADAQGRLAALERTLPALEDRVERSLVSAPVAGKVNRVLVSTIGGTVAPGAPLVEIVPSGDSLLFEARLLPKDVGFVRLGQEARINVTAYQSNVYGALDGRVVSISPDATVDERSGDSFYIVQVRSEGALRDARGKALPLGPGMTADISLLGEQRSVLSYLISPFTRLGQRALRE